ncbi:MAG TPA: TolC family protein [Gemmatimonadales bacterium]|nr:TolC family protein [Gemmatimonadales bacterium]
MRWIAGVLTIVVAVPASAQQVSVTLQEAVNRALRVQPAMVQARGDESNAGAQRLAAVGAFIPAVTLNSSAFRQNIGSIVNGVPVPGSTYQYNTGLSFTVDLFDGLRRVQRYRNAAATASAADAGYVNQEYQVTLLTKQAFYNAIANEELVRVAQSQLDRAKQQLQISIDKLHAGSATRSDSLRSTVDYGNARIALLQAQANLATAQANLGRQIGIDSLVRAVPDTALPPMPDSTGLRTAAIESSPQVVQAEAQARAMSATVWDQRSQYFPTLSLSYNTSSQGYTQPWQGFSPTNRNINRLSFALSWTILNGFQREQQQTAASVQRDVAQAHAEDVRRQVNASLTQQLAALSTAFEQISIAQDNVAAATEDLRVQNERYRVGAATILDLLTSQAALTQAEVNLVQTRFNYLIARAQVEAVVGRTL